MEYDKLVEAIAVEKRRMVSDRLVDIILTSKNDEKMPSQLANTILSHWQRDIITTQAGLTALLEAAVTLEPEKTVTALTELQLTGVAEQIKVALVKV